MNEEEMRKEATEMAKELVDPEYDLPVLFEEHLKATDLWVRFLGGLSAEDCQIFKNHLFQIALLGSRVGSKFTLHSMDKLWKKYGFPLT